MKRHLIQSGLTAKLCVLALAALCLLPVPAGAQGMTGVLIIFPSAGLAPGQSLRLTLFNPNGTPVRAQAQVHHTGGILVALGDGSVRSGAFHSLDFKRSDIPLAGEAGTGRLQLRSSVRLSFSEAITPIAVSPITVSLEIVDITDGTSNTVFVGEAPRSSGGGGRDLLLGGAGGDYLLGIAPGQTLRATFFNPPSTGTAAQAGAAGGHVKVFDGSSNLIEQSRELIIPPGEFRSFDFDRHTLNLPGEPGTNRAQLRLQPVFKLSSNQPARVLASFELIDNRTGKTTVLTGQQCLVFYLGGTPGN